MPRRPPHVPPSVEHRLHRERRHAHPAVRERGVGGRQLHHRQLARAQDQGRHLPEPALDPHRARRVHDARKAHDLAQPHGGHVERARERPRHRHLPRVGILVVPRRPGAEVRLERVGLVAQHGRRGDDGADARIVGVEGGRVDEGLERGAGLALGIHGAVVRALGVIPSPDHRADGSRRGLDRDERCLGGIPLGPSNRRAPVGVARARAHQTLGIVLHSGVERRENRESARAQVRLRNVPGEKLANVVDEVRGADGRGRVRREPERDLPVSGGVLLGDESALDHVRQHLVPPRERGLRIAVGRELVRRGDDPDQERGLAGRDLLDVLVEVEERRLLHAAHAPRAPLPQVDLVQIELENLLLRVAELHHHREEGLVELPPHVPLAREEEILDQLLADRAAALHHRAGANVPERRAAHAQQVEPPVPEEAAILARDDGEDEMAGHLPQRDEAPPLLLLIRELPEQLRVDPQEAAGSEIRRSPRRWTRAALPRMSR